MPAIRVSDAEFAATVEEDQRRLAEDERQAKDLENEDRYLAMSQKFDGSEAYWEDAAGQQVEQMTPPDNWTTSGS